MLTNRKENSASHDGAQNLALRNRRIDLSHSRQRPAIQITTRKGHPADAWSTKLRYRHQISLDSPSVSLLICCQTLIFNIQGKMKCKIRVVFAGMDIQIVHNYCCLATFDHAVLTTSNMMGYLDFLGPKFVVDLDAHFSSEANRQLSICLVDCHPIDHSMSYYAL